MSDHTQARILLQAAQRDLSALNAMLKLEGFADEIFGFHVQQAVEKSLKAWLSALGKTYPYTHDINFLLGKLEDAGCDISIHRHFVIYTSFASEVRYVGLEEDAEPIDRENAVAQAQKLYAQISKISQPIADKDLGE